MKLLNFPKHILINTIKYLFVLLFVYAAFSKLLDFNTFQNQLGQSPLLSAYAHIISWAVPISEICIAILLISKRFNVLGLYAFYIMMVMFTTYIVIILNFTSFTPCSCGGVLEKLGWTEHLIFNIIFIILSGILIITTLSNSLKKVRFCFYLLLITVFGIGLITLLFITSEKKIYQNNAFIRRYIPNTIEKLGYIDLKYNSYYIAGFDNSSIYLGNYTVPLSITKLDYSLNNLNEFKITIDSLHLPYRRAIIAVDPPHFYIGDGTVPIIFKGKISDWKAKTLTYNKAYFTQYVLVDSLTIGLSTLLSHNNSNAIGLISKKTDSVFFTINKTSLPQIKHSKFETDGMLLWNKTLQKFIYSYYYKNEFVIFNKDLTFFSSGKTIDTIKKPIIDVAYYSSSKQYKLGGNSIIVNKQSATFDNYLYIHSDRIGRFEDDKILQMASILDMYDVVEQAYKCSFYLFHQKNKKISDFKIYNNNLVAIVDNQLWIYKIKSDLIK